MNASETVPVSPRRDMPTWLSAAIIVLCLIAGAGVLWWYFGTTPTSVAVPGPVTANNAGGWNNGGGPGPAADDIRALGAGNYQVRATPGTMSVTVRQDGTAFFRYNYVGRLVDRPTENLARLPFRSRQPDVANQLQLTPDQVNRLRDAGRNNIMGMKLAAADEAKLHDLWNAYMKADGTGKDAAKKAVLDALKADAAAAQGATRAAIVAQADAVKSILTPDQVKRVQEGPR